jgi:F0F1-type ATP synthase membrane subunit b/b'
MSQLNLTPDPIIIATQAAIFLANLLVIKKLILNPYLAVRARREASTGGSQHEAQKLAEDVLGLEAKITERMRVAHKDAAVSREAIKTAALANRTAKLTKAEVDTKAGQLIVQNKIVANLQEERSNKEATIKTIAQSFFTQVTQ